MCSNSLPPLLMLLPRFVCLLLRGCFIWIFLWITVRCVLSCAQTHIKISAQQGREANQREQLCPSVVNSLHFPVSAAGFGCCATSPSHRGAKGRAGCRGSWEPWGLQWLLRKVSQTSGKWSPPLRAFVLPALSCLNVTGEITVLYPHSFFCWSHASREGCTIPASLHLLSCAAAGETKSRGLRACPYPCAALAETLPRIIQPPLGDTWGQKVFSDGSTSLVPCADQRTKKWVFVFWQLDPDSKGWDRTWRQYTHTKSTAPYVGYSCHHGH